MATKHQGLGRGFGDFFQRTDVDEEPEVITDHAHDHVDEQSDTAPAALTDGSYLRTIPVKSIRPNAKQPRTAFDEAALRELSESIAEVGVLQPIVVTPDGDEFELVMGERRWRASQRAGLTEIPAIVRATDTQDMLRDALLENLHRVQLNPLEEAAAYQQMLDDFGCTQDELAARIKRSRSHIANTIRLMRLPGTVQRHLLDGTLTAGHARALLALERAVDQEHLARRIVEDGLSVRATEEAVKAVLAPPTEVKPHVRAKPGADPEALRWASVLSDRYDTEVKVKRSKGKGTIVLPFDDEDDLERLIGLLNR
ncbi:ParB/RepB/Spo0J family partition protein [Acidipropionibacterium timonense]|uniref:ParB/RepB/Spo0J family partition protein n=1 Tax=Acidipropionibacterium timonense TaxID=2161818 RepID=UPI001030226B|nr:ParB/RepB/Spo0J family partition protein [Acidipropionibacterium timonense]